MDARDRREDAVEKWLPPVKKLAIQSPNGRPYSVPSSLLPLIDESTTVITAPKVLLRHHQPELVQYINLESLVPYLNQQMLLTDDENDILLHLYLSNRCRVLKLLQFIETKGDEGFRRFLKAIADEQEHMGHSELTKLFAAYRCTLPPKPKQPSLQSVANSIALQAAMQPIQGAEFDLEEAIIEPAPADGITGIRPESSEPRKEADSQHTSGQMSSDIVDEVEEIKDLIGNNSPADISARVVRKYPNFIFPSGPMKLKSNSLIYTSLFQWAWGGNEDGARSAMRYLRRSKEISVDVKIVSMEVVHTTDQDLKLLTSALALTDRSGCENKSILKCRLHRRIAGLHYRNSDLEEANEHMDTALQLAHNIGPDIDTIYTNRLKALMLFEDYKKTKSVDCYRDANKFFTRAMDHARQQPESKRIITERVKISKALFHLDMWEEYKKENKEGETLMELECRAQETLEDVEEEYLTDGDKGFLHMTQAKLLICGGDWRQAHQETLKALELNKKCGLEKRTKECEELLTQIPSTSTTDYKS